MWRAGVDDYAKKTQYHCAGAVRTDSCSQMLIFLIAKIASAVISELPCRVPTSLDRSIADSTASS